MNMAIFKAQREYLVPTPRQETAKQGMPEKPKAPSKDAPYKVQHDFYYKHGVGSK